MQKSLVEIVVVVAVLELEVISLCHGEYIETHDHWPSFIAPQSTTGMAVAFAGLKARTVVGSHHG